MAWDLRGNIKGSPSSSSVYSIKVTSTTVGTSLTDLCSDVTLGSGTYRFKFFSTATGSGTTGNTRQVRLTSGGGLATSLVNYTVTLQTSSTTVQTSNSTSINTNIGSGTSAFLGVEAEGLLVVTTPGTLKLQGIRSGTGTWVITAGAVFLAEKLV